MSKEIIEEQMKIVKALAKLADSLPAPYQLQISAEMINRFGELIQEGVDIDRAVDQVRVEMVW